MGWELDIELSTENQVYLPGTIVEGYVVLEVLENSEMPEKIREIKITFFGEANTRWRANASNNSSTNSSTTVCYDSEVLFRVQRLLSGGDNELSEVITLTAGVHKFPFQFQIPSDGCPSSFKSEAPGEGSIRYWLTAVVTQSSGITYTKERDITVNELVDINIPQLIEPLSNSNEKTVCCLCCTSGPISLSVTTDRGGYCIGESIAISIEAKNCLTRRRVTAVRATLKQKATLYAKDRTSTHSQPAERVEEKVIQRIEGPGIDPGGTCTWVNKPLLIPVAIAPTINSCRIVKLSYCLTATLALPYAKDLHVTIPITIGNASQ